MRKPKKSGLSKAYEMHAQTCDRRGKTTPRFFDSQPYTDFFNCYAAAFKDIFVDLARLSEISNPGLFVLIVDEGEHVSMRFVATREMTRDENGYPVAGDLEPETDRLFANLYEALANIAGDEMGLRFFKDGEGVYNLQIVEPRAALGLLRKLLELNQTKCSDMQPNERYSRSFPAAGPVDPDYIGKILDYIPPQIFLSAAVAQETGRYNTEKRAGYGFSLNYMEALLAEAESKSHRKQVNLPDHLQTYRRH